MSRGCREDLIKNLTDHQTSMLKDYFAGEQNPDSEELERLGDLIDLAKPVVKHWFSLQRQRIKAENEKLGK